MCLQQSMAYHNLIHFFNFLMEHTYWCPLQSKMLLIQLNIWYYVLTKSFLELKSNIYGGKIRRSRIRLRYVLHYVDCCSGVSRKLDLKPIVGDFNKWDKLENDIGIVKDKIKILPLDKRRGKPSLHIE